MVARDVSDPLPRAFAAAVAQLRAARLREASLRPAMRLEEVAAPGRIAPYAVALSADILGEEEEDVGTGRLVVLHDPAGHDAWQGTFRCVAFVRADVEPEMGADPLLPTVAWSWLTDALADRDAGHHAASGTITRVNSECFGAMATDPSVAEVEIRASWTPAGELGPHLSAWTDLLYRAAGLPPVPAGVRVMAPRRGRRR